MKRLAWFGFGAAVATVAITVGAAILARSRLANLSPDVKADVAVAVGTIFLALVTIWLGIEARKARRDQARQIDEQMSALQAPYVHPGDYGWDLDTTYLLPARNDGKGVAWDIRAEVRWRDEEDFRRYAPIVLGPGNEANCIYYADWPDDLQWNYQAYGHFLYRDSLGDHWVTRFSFSGGQHWALSTHVWSYERVENGDIELVPPDH